MKFRNIYPNGNGHYKIQKYSNGKNRYYGTYRTIIEALMARDKCIHGEWKNTKEKKPFIHIYKISNGYYQIIRRYKGKLRSYGVYRTLIEALMARDVCMQKKWQNYRVPANIHRGSNGGFVVEKTIDGVREYFGIYNTLEEAEAEVEVLRSVGWDFDLWCEVDDRVDGRVVYLNKQVEA